MPPSNPIAKPAIAPPRRSLVRTIGPAVPLAIAIAHHALSPSNPAPVLTPPVISQSAPQSSGQPGAAPCTSGGAELCPAPVPLLTKGHPVDWWFVFKLNASVFPKCGDGTDSRACPFDDSSIKPASYRTGFGQRFLVASSNAPALVDGGPQCIGTSTSDPVGATFDEVYNGGYHFLIWNDQFHDLPPSTVLGCSDGDCGSPWGHSKGMLAWNDAGEGFVMQVSTPSWPGSGSPSHQRKIGNTLGCIVGDDDVGVSQHFFALRLTKPDLLQVLKGLNEASVATDPQNPQVVDKLPGSPVEVTALISTLGKKSQTTTLDPDMPVTLSSGVRFIAKPSGLHVPPWQMVSAELGGIPLRAATWWAAPYISSTTDQTPVPCWDPSIHGTPAAVEIASTGTWGNPAHTFSLESSPGTNGNHAKIGVSTTSTHHLAIFGDENQQGTLGGPGEDCGSSQNGRGGIFFVMENEPLSTSIGALIGVGTPGAVASAGTPPTKR